MERYSRQVLFAPIGVEGQIMLAEKHVVIIGLGALGTQNAEMLARAGVGKLTIVDRDYIEWSNLQRQTLYTEADAENQLPKAIAAKRRLTEINSEIDIESHIMDVTPIELERLVKGADLLIDATDNFDIRMMMNDVAQKHQIPWIYGSCVGSYGISYTIFPNDNPCLHCLLEAMPLGGPTCDTAGIIHPTVSQVVVHQTTEALKILTNHTDALRKKIVSFDVWENRTVQMDVTTLKNQQCLSCGPNATYPYLNYESQLKTALLCGRNAVQIKPPKPQQRDLTKIAEHLQTIGGHVKANNFLLSFSIEEKRLVLFQDGRALIHGTNDLNKAKTYYHRYFG